MRYLILIVAMAIIILNGSIAKAAEIFDIAQGAQPRVAASRAGIIHIVFEGYKKDSEIREILYSQSRDNARTWTLPLNISQTVGVSTTPAIAIENNGAIDVIWRDTTSGELHPNIYFTRSIDEGKTWTKALNISNSPGICSEPSIATGPDNSIHVVWVDTKLFNGRPDIFYSCSLDGKTWSPCVDISPTPGVSSQPTITASKDGIIHCAWLDTSSGEERPDIFYVRRVNNVWITPVDISNSPKISDHPWLANGSKGKIFLCWADNSQKENAADIWCAISKNDRFAKPINISDTPGVSGQPVVIADEACRVAVVWSDASLKRLKPDIYTRVSTDNGDDFSNVMFLTNTAGLSKHPTATFIGTKMVIVWEDIEGFVSKLKATIVELKSIPTGPVDQVNPTIHRVNR